MQDSREFLIVVKSCVIATLVLGTTDGFEQCFVSNILEDDFVSS